MNYIMNQSTDHSNVAVTFPNAGGTPSDIHDQLNAWVDVLGDEDEDRQLIISASPYDENSGTLGKGSITVKTNQSTALITLYVSGASVEDKDDENYITTIILERLTEIFGSIGLEYSIISANITLYEEVDQ